MPRVHFDFDDLVQTRFACTPLPMYELVFGVRARQWDRALLCAIAPLAELIRPKVAVPAFLSSAQPRFVDAVDEVLNTPADVVRPQLAALGATSPWLRAFGRGEVEARSQLRAALHSYHRTRLAPAWPTMVQTFDAEVRVRSRLAVTDGMGAMLGSLHPSIRWSSPVLHVGDGADLYLGGRGLLLVPITHTLISPVVSGSVLCYPATTAPVDGTSLEGALGRTRTQVLRALTTERTTTDLARFVGISLPTASQHATALRGAGFVATQRAGRAVRHRLTQRGWELLN